MAFREVRVFEVRETLRLWLAGEGVRATDRLVGLDRKSVRRYAAARSSSATGSWGRWWRITARSPRVENDLTAVKIHDLLCRRGVAVPCRTVQRYMLEAAAGEDSAAAWTLS